MALSGIMTTSLLSANNSMKIARVQQGAKNQMDGHAGVLDAEIKLDSARGGDVKKKAEKAAEKKRTEKKDAEERIDKMGEAATSETGEGTPLEDATINVVVDGVTPSTGVSGTIGVSVDEKA